MKQIKYINKEIEKIKGIEYDINKKSKNGIFCPKFNKNNIELVHNYVKNNSSYSGNSGDNFVKKYFQEHKGDVSLATVITKVILIDTIDSTNLKHLLGKDYYKIIAKKIIDNDIESNIAIGGSFGDKFKKLASFPPKKTSKKEDLNLFVFFSKYITRVNQYSYEKSDYSILDDVLKNNLKHFNEKDIKIPNIEHLRKNYDFDGYCSVFNQILDKFPGITREMIDHFVWFTFKKEAVGDKE